MIKSLIDDTNPSLIISFYPGYAVHPDHEATADAVIRTVERMPKEERPRLTLVAFSNDATKHLENLIFKMILQILKNLKLRHLKHMLLKQVHFKTISKS